MLPDLAGAALAQRRVVVLVTVGLALVTAVWVGYAIGRGQSLAEIARLYRDQALTSFNVEGGELIAEFDRVGGAYKPLLKARDGTFLVEYSDWDDGSLVTVDGERAELVRLKPTSSVDYGKKRIVSGLVGDDWTLSREITLNERDATVQYWFVAQRPIEAVTLRLAHINWYYLNAELTPDGYVADVARGTRADIETRAVTVPTHRLRVSAEPGPATTIDGARIVDPTPYGIRSITTEYTVRRPAVGAYTPIMLERVSYTRR